MPLETIGSYALAGSSGTVARNARSASGDYPNAAFVASPARGGKSGGAVELPSPAPNVAAYVSPYIRLDLQTRLAIVEYRDSESGQVEQQYPSPRVVREYQQNLPENSVLPFSNDEADPEEGAGPAAGETVLSGDTRDASPSSAAGADESKGEAPLPVAPAIASAAAAAFTTARVAPAGRELAVA